MLPGLRIAFGKHNPVAARASTRITADPAGSCPLSGLRYCASLRETDNFAIIPPV